MISTMIQEAYYSWERGGKKGKHISNGRGEKRRSFFSQCGER